MTAPLASYSRRCTPAFAAGGLGHEPNPKTPNHGWPFTPLGGWVCYHCGDRFMGWQAARRHFGATPDDVPACIGAAKAIVSALRRHARHVDLPKEVVVQMVRVDAIARKALSGGSEG